MVFFLNILRREVGRGKSETLVYETTDGIMRFRAGITT